MNLSDLNKRTILKTLNIRNIRILRTADRVVESNKNNSIKDTTTIVPSSIFDLTER